MTRNPTLAVAAISANDLFKLRYSRHLQGAILASLALTALFIWMWPGYEAQPYRLRQDDATQIIDIDPVAPVIEPPKPAEMPRVPPIVEPAAEEDPDAVETVPDMIPIDTPISPGPAREWSDEGFVASSSNPVLLQGAKADYPLMARRAGMQGIVLVQVLVGADGRVELAEIQRSVHPILDEAALAAARRFLFTPGKQRGNPVAVWVAIPFSFRVR